MASTVSPQQEDAGDTIPDKSSQVIPEQDIVSDIPEEPSAPTPRWEGIMQNRWFIIAVVVLGVVAILFLLRFRRRQKDTPASEADSGN